MTLLELLLIVGFVMVGYRILRGVMGSGIDLIEEGRKQAERLAEGLPQTPSPPPPGPRPPLRPGARTTAEPASRMPRTSPSRTTPVRSTSRPARVPPPEQLDEWYLVLDVSPAADRREIQEAIKLRLSRARADRDSEGVKRVMRAATTALGQWRRGSPR